MQNYLFTSESVSEGHPDKVSDQISDAILDAYLSQDKKSRVACETLITDNLIVVAGEVLSKGQVDVESIARDVVKDIGYDHEDKGFDYNTCKVQVVLGKQSPDISQGVDRAPDTIGAGDQGLMFGYAVNETPEFMPLSIHLSHQLTKTLAHLRKSQAVDFLRPDSKSQVTVKYKNGKVDKITSIVLSTQHDEKVSLEDLISFVKTELIEKVIPSHLMDSDTQILINPTGRFVVGGPKGDCGLTGRKIIVDTYGGHGAHGGGAFSGKDASKVDRSAAYAARHAAKNIVAAGLAERCLVQLAYAIGVVDPVGIMVEDYGTSSVGPEVLSEALKKVYSFQPYSLIQDLELEKPVFRKTSNYGHFGREDFPWERLNKMEELKKVASSL